MKKNVILFFRSTLQLCLFLLPPFLPPGGLGFTPMLALALFASRNPNTFEHFDLLLNATLGSTLVLRL